MKNWKYIMFVVVLVYHTSCKRDAHESLKISKKNLVGSWHANTFKQLRLGDTLVRSINNIKHNFSLDSLEICDGKACGTLSYTMKEDSIFFEYMSPFEVYVKSKIKIKRVTKNRLKLIRQNNDGKLMFFDLERIE